MDARETADLWLRRASILLAVIGLLVASYLVYIKFNPSSTLCVGAGDCEAVNTSIYSEFRGIPVAALGALSYAFLLGVLLLESRWTLAEEWGPLAVFGMALAGTLYSAYLTYIEVAVLHKICPYCVTSAVVMTLIFVISSVRLKRYFG
jgi:uncharacterized membrane protein